MISAKKILSLGLLLFFLFSIFSFLFSGVVSAQGLPPLLPECSPTGSGGLDKCTVQHFLQLIRNAIQWLTIIAVPLAVFFIIWGGFVIMTAGGDQGRLGQGKKILTTAIVGLVIVFSAWLIINTFARFFLKSPAEIGF